MGKCCRWDWLVRPGDTPDEATIKTIAFPFGIFLFLFMVGLIVRQMSSTVQMIFIIGTLFIALAQLLFIGGVLSNVIPVYYILDACLFLSTVGICAQDLGNATRTSPFRSWTYVVLVLDIALVFKRYPPPPRHHPLPAGVPSRF
eukprot:Hpha_TRINITY_DN15384_c5_g1::TRINITY_DN15384_c5_g1_i1::g.88079::m.88079